MLSLESGMKNKLIKSVTILAVPILFTCFVLVLVVGLSIIATTAVVRTIYNLLEKPCYESST